VTVNGRPVPIIPSDPEGWITVPVPDGRSTIQATFGETPLRAWADGLSLVSVVLLLVVGNVAARPLRVRLSVKGKRPTAHRLPLTAYGLPLTVALLLIAAKFWLVDAGQTPLRQAELHDGMLAGVARPTAVTLGTASSPAQVRLWGLDEWTTAVPADQPLTLTLYWQALQPLAPTTKLA
jgi:hypothetical protein